MFAPLCGVNICVWRFAPNTGGVAALATINDGALLLIEGELDFVAAKRQQKTERIFVRLTVGILRAFICRHQGVRGSSQSRF